MKKALPVLAVLLAALLLWGRGVRGDPGALAERFYRRLFESEEARTVFGMEEEDVLAVFGEEETEAERL